MFKKHFENSLGLKRSEYNILNNSN